MTSYEINDIVNFKNSGPAKLLDRFDCISEDKSMNEFLQKEAFNCHSEGKAITKIVFDKDQNDIIGYYTLKCSSLRLNIDKEDGTQEVFVEPAIEIARIAINKQYQGKECNFKNYKKKKYAEFVYDHIMDDVEKIRDQYAGVTVITLFAVNDKKTLRFYDKLKFERVFGNQGAKTVFKSTDNIDCIPMVKWL